ncbi:peptidylprolyl isomerase [Paenibacillus soyae]|uniref:peptidylprolyl isomerase n=1 Tax=Paenibacillus soyae TaxID=2969249 RepID=A0A9X2MWL9_9BACL|nr:peptidylprolyl isomerase [Paenibacillus soyae]MCR2807243.1 peptidylprolyl isomerase [Paenibacillus soyae]
MKRNEVLKTVVILQAVCMIALAGFVMAKAWPLPSANGNVRDTEEQDDGAVAVVGNQVISKDRLTEELIEQYGDAVLRQLMIRQAIELEAEASGLAVAQEEANDELKRSAEGYENEEQFFDVMKEQLGMSRQQVMEDIRYRLLLQKIAVKDIPVSDEEVRQYIEDHPERFGEKRQYHLLWIVTATRAQAENILSRLESGEDFSELAGTYSIDEFTSQSGGDLGLVDADDPFYDEAVLSAASGMAIAEIAGPIELEEGYAVIELAGTRSTAALTGERLLELARKELALERAKPQQELEDELLSRYDAAIMK